MLHAKIVSTWRVGGTPTTGDGHWRSSGSDDAARAITNSARRGSSGVHHEEAARGLCSRYGVDSVHTSLKPHTLEERASLSFVGLSRLTLPLRLDVSSIRCRRLRSPWHALADEQGVVSVVDQQMCVVSGVETTVTMPVSAQRLCTRPRADVTIPGIATSNKKTKTTNMRGTPAGDAVERVNIGQAVSRPGATSESHSHCKMKDDKPNLVILKINPKRKRSLHALGDCGTSNNFVRLQSLARLGFEEAELHRSLLEVRLATVVVVRNEKRVIRRPKLRKPRLGSETLQLVSAGQAQQLEMTVKTLSILTRTNTGRQYWKMELESPPTLAPEFSSPSAVSWNRFARVLHDGRIEQICILSDVERKKCEAEELKQLVTEGADAFSQVEEVMLRRAELKLTQLESPLRGPARCSFGASEISVLGYLIGTNVIRPDLGKVKLINEWPSPSKVKEQRPFLGFATYLCKYISNYAGKIHPLSQLLNKGAALDWSTECHEAFAAVKQGLTEAPILVVADQDCPFHVVCDASDFAIGCALMWHGHEGRDRVVYYPSRQLKTAQRNNPVHNKELLTVKYALA
ncbi:unnamed protein product [Phytophthora fragariaefolia]|uniref:Unnamed protein product n=1 Tax=Phytophthora fragariaefolia TaxID=1490495 RepID=A0A9W6Y8Y5_9STRA|nr:unnamed protein product [Phytophthora fragariaefolia]